MLPVLGPDRRSLSALYRQQLKEEKNMKINKDLIGKFVRVRFDDIGIRDAICIHVDSSYKQFTVFIDGDKQTIENDQLVKVGPRINVPKF